MRGLTWANRDAPKSLSDMTLVGGCHSISVLEFSWQWPGSIHGKWVDSGREVDSWQKREATGLSVRPMRSLTVLQPPAQYCDFRVGKTVKGRSGKNFRLLTSWESKDGRKGNDRSSSGPANSQLTAIQLTTWQGWGEAVGRAEEKGGQSGKWEKVSLYSRAHVPLGYCFNLSYWCRFPVAEFRQYGTLHTSVYVQYIPQIWETQGVFHGASFRVI